MKLSDLKDKKIGIFGFGVEGRSLLDFLLDHDFKNLVIFDEKDIENLQSDIEKRIGGFEDQAVDDIDIAFRSPGVKRERLERIVSNKTKISSSTNLFFANKKGKVIAVTGTKGKSTTVQLISYMLRSANLEVFTGGNIGESVLDFLDKTSENTYSVIELSSFQLQDLEYGPNIAVILPIFPDHLDYHDDINEYISAKSQLLKRMGENDAIFCAKQQKAQDIVSGAKAKIFLFAEGDSLISAVAKKYKIPEINLAATAKVGEYLGIKENLQEIAENFIRLPFRIQFLSGDKGVDFYNDSAATNPISTIKAMETIDVPYLLIAGGSSKNLSFKDLAKVMKEDENLKSVYLIGETAKEIEKELDEINFEKPVYNLNNLDDVFEKIANGLTGVKVVLFSPASASFDQFKNYKERGEYFNIKVKQFLTK